MDDNFEIAKQSYKNVNELSDIWNNPIVRFIFSAIKASFPACEIIDNALNKKLEIFQKKSKKSY